MTNNTLALVNQRRTEINQMKGQIAQAVPKTITADRMLRACLTAVSQNPKLSYCTRESFLGAMMQLAALGLEPNTPLGHAYLIPYKDKCQLQLGYKGILELARRTGLYQNIYAMEVYEFDEFAYEYGLDMTLKHKPAEYSEGESVKYYALFKLHNGGVGFKVWSRQKIEHHAKKYSKSFFKKDGPWQTSFDAMAKKTVLLDLLKTAPMSSEMGQAAYADAAIVTHQRKNGIDEFEYTHEKIDEKEIDQIIEADEMYESNEEELQEMLAHQPVVEEVAPESKPESKPEPKKKPAVRRRLAPEKLKEEKEAPKIADESLNKEAYIAANKSVYETIETCIATERVKMNKKVLGKLLELKNMAVSKEHEKGIQLAVRNALNNDFGRLDFLIESSTEFD